MSEIKLLPCPFCGGEATVYDDEYNHYAIGCKLCCDVTPVTTWEDTVEKASAIWNTRKPMERIVERLEEESGYYGYFGSEEQMYVPLDSAIEIVKEEGGIE